MTDSLITLTSEIISSFVAHNSVRPADVPELMASVHGALTELSEGKADANVEEEQPPAVSVRKSIRPDALTCLVCGKEHKSLRRHISNAHGLEPDAYRAKFGLPKSYPMVAPEYAAKRSELAKSAGLGRKGDASSGQPVTAPAVEAKADGGDAPRKRGRPRKVGQPHPKSAQTGANAEQDDDVVVQETAE